MFYVSVTWVHMLIMLLPLNPQGLYCCEEVHAHQQMQSEVKPVIQMGCEQVITSKKKNAPVITLWRQCCCLDKILNDHFLCI